MPCEPVIKEGFLYITGGVDLEFEPGIGLILFDMHWDVVRLCHPCKPMALYTSVGKTKKGKLFKHYNMVKFSQVYTKQKFVQLIDGKKEMAQITDLMCTV